MCAGCLKKRSPFFFGTPCGCIVGQICMIVLSYRLIFMENCIDRLVQGVSKRSRLFLGHPADVYDVLKLSTGTIK